MALIKPHLIVALVVIVTLAFVAARPNEHSAYPDPERRKDRNYEDAVAQPSEDRVKRHHYHHHGRGITGPVHTFVKTDKHANFKWGVRHHVGHNYA